MSDEFPANEDPRDMLGDPIDANRELIGAPSLKITEQKQTLVAVLRAAGWTQERIATQIGCSIKTLRKHFSPELDRAGDNLEARALEVIATRMIEGNSAAASKILAMIEKGRAAVPLAPAAGDDDGDEMPGAAPLGKKEQLAEAAKNPGLSWGQILPH